jgi:hypoxanthine-guanine phosphoribosyltransferase
MKMSIEDSDVKDQNVLIIKDIYDSGVYMQSLHEKVKAFSPKKASFAIAFHKKNTSNLKYNFFAEYTGFLIPD